MKKKTVWITWEDHRRSRELAKRFSADYYVIDSTLPTGISHLVCVIRTILLLFRCRNNVVVVQNPSRILAALAGVLKNVLGYCLIVDRHSNFRVGKGLGWNPAIWFVVLCSEISLRLADLTIVTNSFLAEIVDKKGGKSFVLTDAIPDLSKDVLASHIGRPSEPNLINVFFICTFSQDEPFTEVIEASKLLPEYIRITVTGNFEKGGYKKNPQNHKLDFVGYVSNEEYERLLIKSDIVMVFTTADWCLVCGGYEAIAAEKPLITSQTQALMDFYGDGAMFSKHDPNSIVRSIEEVVKDIDKYRLKSKALKSKKLQEWEERYLELRLLIDDSL